jgi:HD-GYP domain-containing protein (c-di-GMP phosphodiesterase class II)
VYRYVIDWFPAHSTTTADPRTVARLRWQAFALVRRMAREVDAQHRATVGHSERAARLSMALGEVLGWSSRDIERLGEAALVHDVGKICIPAEILGSPVALTDEQMALVRHHPRISAEMVTPALDAEQVSWVRHHHERWDGRGYPDGLRGAQIPSGAQLLSVADAWDAMTTRPGPRNMNATQALVECQSESGHQFAPSVVAAVSAAVERSIARPWRRSGRRALTVTG